MTWLLLALATATIQLLLAELFDWFPWLARRVIRRAAHLLPRAERARYEEEWLADLDALPGRKISKLVFAFIVFANAPRTRRAMPATTEQPAFRRALDVAFAAMCLASLAPSLATIGLAIRLTSPGSALFRESRLGRGGRPFTMFKFRTTGPFRSGGRDLLHHPLGRALRSSALDEFPRLWSVFRGDMSLIGPPPRSPELRHTLNDEELAIKPGMTSWTALAYLRYLPLDEAQRRDREHREAWSLRKDVLLLLASAKAMSKDR
jgi:lipopolysaccharide/colanic/teichoic acid biosynthesis glycosyltransferase